MMTDQIAGQVVLKRDPFAFTVDGEDFPWFLPYKRSPVITRLDDDLWAVGVSIMGIGITDHESLDFAYVKRHGASMPNVPVIGGVEFPWLLSDHEMTLTFGHKFIPELKLAFFARAVETDFAVVDRRPEVPTVYCTGGNLIRKGAS